MSPATLYNKLGEGAFGKVYQGEYKGEAIAVKVINLRNAPPREQEKAEKEIALLAALAHPNVVLYKGGYVSSGPQRVELHIYMELCLGGDLQGAIDRQKASGYLFSEGLILGWFQDTVKAVQYLHSNNIIHRDIKPQNILLHNDCIKLGDFGFAKLLHSRQDFNASVTGTVIYACPEILFNNVGDQKGDMWSLGCTLFQLATLEPPFGNIREVIKFMNDRSRLSAIPRPYSDNIISLVDVLLRYDPTKRPDATSVLHIFNKLEAAVQRRPTHSEPAAAPVGRNFVGRRRFAVRQPEAEEGAPARIPGRQDAVNRMGRPNRNAPCPLASRAIDMDEMEEDMMINMLMQMFKRS